MKHSTTHNRPIATVIKNYLDKKSGKVTASRSEIQRRFYGLDWSVQKKILNAFLDAGVKDREWAYSRLLNLWDASFETKIKELWEEHHDVRCAWVIIRHFPLDYLKQHTEELSGDRNYYFICRRMAEDKDFVINRDLLSQTDYLMVMQHTHRHLEDAEAKDILFQAVHQVAVHWWPYLELSRDYKPDRREMMSLTDFSKVSLVLYYLGKMGKEEVIKSFSVWDKAIQSSVSHSTEYAELLKRPLSDYDFAAHLAAIMQKHLYHALPEKYKKEREEPLMGAPLYEGDSILNK